MSVYPALPNHSNPIFSQFPIFVFTLLVLSLFIFYFYPLMMLFQTLSLDARANNKEGKQLTDLAVYNVYYDIYSCYSNVSDCYNNK
jgi:hypothetical protein